jgi:integrase
MPSVWVEPRRNKRGRTWLVRWEVEIRDPETGAVKSYLRDSESCGPSKAYAEKRVTQIRDELYAGKLRIRKRSFGLDLFTLLDRYAAERKGARAASTYENFILPAVEGFKAWKGNIPASMVEQKDLVDWRNWMTEKGLSQATVRARLRDLMIAFAWAVDQDLLDRHPVRKRNDILPKPKSAGRYITPEEVEALLCELPDRPRRACYIALHQGLRKGEVIQAAWPRVYTRATPWELEILPGKNGDARVVTLHPNVVTMLGEPRPSGQLIEGLSRDMFDNHIPDALRRLAAAGRDLGRIRFHDFRHTSATNFMWRHGDIFRLMREFGWRSLGAARVYQHFTRRGNVPEYPPFSHYFPINGVRKKGQHGQLPGVHAR